MKEYKSKITISGIKMDGKYQDEWFLIFDTLESIFKDKQRLIEIEFNHGEVGGWVFTPENCPKGTLREKFANFCGFTLDYGDDAEGIEK